MAEVDPVKIAVDIIDRTTAELAKIQARIRQLGLQDVEVDVRANIDNASFARARASAQMWGAGLENVLGFTGPDQRRGSIFGDMGDLRESFRGLGRTLVRYRPSIMDWWNVLALLIPIIITLAGAAVGLIAALGGVAVAASGILGVGLLGWGDSMTESLQRLREEALALGSELFNVLRPAAAVLQPLMERAMNQLPGLVANLNDELMGLADFGPGLGEIGRGFMDWVEGSIQLINQWRDVIITVALEVGRGFGTFIQDFLVFGLREVNKNIGSYRKLAQMFADVLRLIFELSKIAAFTVAQFEPLFDLLSRMAQALSSKWSIAAITFATSLFLGSFALVEMVSAIRALMGIQFVASLQFWARQLDLMALKTYQWLIAVETLRGALIRLLALTGAGLVFAGAATLAGRALAGSSGSRGGSTTSITIEGDVGRREMHRMQDMFPGMYDRESSMSGGI